MLDAYLVSQLVLLIIATAAWLYSLRDNNVNIVDSLWSMMFLAAALITLQFSPHLSGKNYLLLLLMAVWALRLSVFLAIRNAGKAEDRRYREMRNRHGNAFRNRSLFTVFWLQAVIAGIIFSALLPAFYQPLAFSWLDIVALIIWSTGLLIESVADYQLYRFQKQPQNRGKILRTGLWAYSRHPNYFGESLVWWGMYLLIAVQVPYWAIAAPVIMPLLLLKVSGVALMEKNIDQRRPGYADYIRNTPAFFPRLFPARQTQGEVSS